VIENGKREPTTRYVYLDRSSPAPESP
jgi:hypothetical protein